METVKTTKKMKVIGSLKQQLLEEEYNEKRDEIKEMAETYFGGEDSVFDYSKDCYSMEHLMYEKAKLEMLAAAARCQILCHQEDTPLVKLLSQFVQYMEQLDRLIQGQTKAAEDKQAKDEAMEELYNRLMGYSLYWLSAVHQMEEKDKDGSLKADIEMAKSLSSLYECYGKLLAESDNVVWREAVETKRKGLAKLCAQCEPNEVSYYWDLGLERNVREFLGLGD